MPAHPEKKAQEVWKSVQKARGAAGLAREPDALAMSSSGYVGHEGQQPLGKGDWLPKDAAARIIGEHGLHEGLSEDAVTAITNMLRSAETYARVLEIVGYTGQLRPEGNGAEGPLHRTIWGEKQKREDSYNRMMKSASEAHGIKPADGGQPLPPKRVADLAREHNLHEGLSERDFEALVDNLYRARSEDAVRRILKLFENLKKGPVPP